MTGRRGSTRLFEDFCIKIRRDIAAGRLKPGDKLPGERELAEEMGVGRPVVREGLRSLEEAGLLELRLGVSGGAFIRDGDASTIVRSVTDLVFLGAISIENLTEARTLLLCRTVELVAERAEESDLDLLDENLALASAAAEIGPSDDPDLISLVQQFYDLLGYAAKNEMLVFLIHSVSEVIRQVLLKFRPDIIQLTLSSRRRLMTHLRARDAAAASAEVTTHLTELHDLVLDRARTLHMLELDPTPTSRAAGRAYSGRKPPSHT